MDGDSFLNWRQPVPGSPGALIAHAVSPPIHWPDQRTQVPFSYHQASDSQCRGVLPPSISRPSGIDLSLLDLSVVIPTPVRFGRAWVRRRHWLARNGDVAMKSKDLGICDRLLS